MDGVNQSRRGAPKVHGIVWNANPTKWQDTQGGVVIGRGDLAFGDKGVLKAGHEEET